MTFTINWYTCPNGRGKEPRISHDEYSENLCEAITYLRKKYVETDYYWDCGEVSSKGQVLFALDEAGSAFIIPRTIAWDELSDMTSRQKEISVTVFGYLQGIIMNDFLANDEAFLAIAGTLERGRHLLGNILNLWFGYGYTELEVEKVHKFLSELSARKPEYFSYSSAYGISALTVY